MQRYLLLPDTTHVFMRLNILISGISAGDNARMGIKRWNGYDRKPYLRVSLLRSLRSGRERMEVSG